MIFTRTLNKAQSKGLLRHHPNRPTNPPYHLDMPKHSSQNSNLIDELTLLCESCGYILEDLDQSLPCPECGKPIKESLPHKREGSPWQYERSLRTMITTWFLILFKPRKTIPKLNLSPSGSMALMWYSLLLASLTPTMVLGVYFIINAFRFEDALFGLFALIAYIILGLIYLIVAVIYATLAIPRVRWITKLRGHRLPFSVVWTAVEHAALGLTLAPLLICFNMLLLTIDDVFLYNANSTVQLAMNLAINIVGFLSLPLAIIEFEVLLRLGIRELRFRNPAVFQSNAPRPPIQRPTPPLRTDMS